MSGKKKREFRKPSPENTALGQALREYRNQRNQSQEEFGADAGLDRTYISLIERGQQSPTFSTVYSICKTLGVTLPVFFSRTQEILDELGTLGDAGKSDNG